VRLLERRDLDEVLDLLDRDPVADVFVASRIQASGLAESRLGAQVWGYGERGRLESLCYSGANLVPVQAGPRPSGPSPSAPGGRVAAARRSSASPARSSTCGRC
jgi:hypothetical protein